MSEPQAGVLDLQGIGFSYPSPADGRPVVVLSDISLTVDPGRLVVVAGRSGSGKTSLLRVATGLVQSQEGEVLWDGHPIHRLNRDALADWRRNSLGIVSQGDGLISTLTAEENVALAGFGFGQQPDPRRTQRLLGDFAMALRARHFPSELSAGERVRVAMARALYQDPPLLVADEPTASLDRVTADRLIDSIVKLRNNNRGLLVATHDPALIAKADDLVELE